MKSYLRSNWVSILIIVAVVLYGIYQAPHLPDQIPTHFDLQGNPNRYSSKAAAIWVLPGISLLATLMISVFIRISPEHYNMPHSREVLGKVNAAIVLLLAVIQVGMLMNAANPGAHNLSNFLVLALASFMLMAGNVMSKVERNFFIGIRTPWSLASEENWHATHRIAARTMVIAGLLMVISAFTVASFGFALAVMAAAMLWPVWFSYRYFARTERK